MESSEQRAYDSREHDRVEVNLYVNKLVRGEPHVATARDLSVGGMFIANLLEPEASEGRGVVAIEFQLPNSYYVIWALGEVVRREGPDEKPGVAVRFLSIAQYDRELIARYVALLRELADPE